MQPDMWRGVRFLCDEIVAWQATGGGLSLETCPYHRDTPFGFPSGFGQDIPWLARSLYAASDLLHEPGYKEAADRYAIYFLANTYDNAPAYQIGGALEPCLKLYRDHNLWDQSLINLYCGFSKAKALYRWLLAYRTDNGNYFNCGYGFQDDKGVLHADEDVGFSCDLSDVGRGLIGYYRLFKDEEALSHAMGLARYFVTEAESDTYQGIWSSKIGTWLFGPRHTAGFENFDNVYADEGVSGWSAYYGSLFLARLYDCIKDEAFKATIRDRCVSSLRWWFDACQFEDGAMGMSGRDDKWLGMTATAIMQYGELGRRLMIGPQIHHQYYPKALKALAWLRAMRQPERFPSDGYIPVTGKSKPWPGWNTTWMMALTAEGLMAGPTLEAMGTP